MSERARGADVAADETADKPSVPDVPSHPISLATAAEWSAQVGPEAAADLDPRYMKPMDDSAGEMPLPHSSGTRNMPSPLRLRLFDMPVKCSHAWRISTCMSCGSASYMQR